MKIIETETGRRRFAFGYVMYTDVCLIPLSNIEHAHAHDTRHKRTLRIHRTHGTLRIMRYAALGLAYGFGFDVGSYS